MANENEFLNDIQESSDEFFDYDVLEKEIQDCFGDREFWQAEKEKIGNPEELCKVMGTVVWDQFIFQVANTIGQEFLDENNGLTLDLRKESHIQTTDNFEKGKIATHNTEIDYQQRYDDWQSNFVKDSEGNVVTHTTRMGKQEATLKSDARKPFDKGRPSGSAEKHTDMDHTKSAAEVIRDPGANAHMTKDEQIAFENSDINLNEMDSSWNRSKGDKSMSDWLDNPNSSGQKPNEIFDISPEKERELRTKDAEAREEYEKQLKDAEDRSKESGKRTQKAETLLIGKKVVKAAIITLLTDLLREIIVKLIHWFKSSKKSIDTLINSVSEAIKAFVSQLKKHLVNAGNAIITTLTTAILGPISNLIKKAWILLKQSWSSLKEAIEFIRNPQNRNLPFDFKMLEVGKIIIAGMTGVGAVALGEVAEKALMVTPLAIEIPLLGNLANVLGIFFGAVVAGIIGAIALNLIDKIIAKKQKQEITKEEIGTNNTIIGLQKIQKKVAEVNLAQTKTDINTSISARHSEASNIMRGALEKIEDNCKNNSSVKNRLSNMNSLILEMEGE